MVKKISEESVDSGEYLFVLRPLHKMIDHWEAMRMKSPERLCWFNHLIWLAGFLCLVLRSSVGFVAIQNTCVVRIIIVWYRFYSLLIFEILFIFLIFHADYSTDELIAINQIVLFWSLLFFINIYFKVGAAYVIFLSYLSTLNSALYNMCFNKGYLVLFLVQ